MISELLARLYVSLKKIMNGESNSYTGRQRDRKTKPIVKISDVLARIFITMGGMGTILAVSTVFIFLVYVAVPLFFPAKITNPVVNKPAWSDMQQRLVHLSVDEYRTIGWAFFDDGSIVVFRCDTGQRLGEVLKPFAGRNITAWNFNNDSDDVYFGFDDGSAQLARIGIDVEFLSENQVPAEVAQIDLDSIKLHSDGVYVQPRSNQFRLHRFKVNLEEPIKLSDFPIDLISHTITSSGQLVVALTDGKLSINSVRQRRNLLTGNTTSQVRRSDIAVEAHLNKLSPEYLLVSQLGNTIYLAWQDGKLQRYDSRNIDNLQLVETLYLTEDDDTSLTSLEFLIGKTTLISGDSDGNVKAWFCVPDEYKLDLVSIKETHNLGNFNSAITSLSGSARSRLLAAGLADGRVKLFYVTSNRVLAEQYVSKDAANPEVIAVALGARENSVFAATSDYIANWDVHLSHPAINLKSLFGKVWYEGYAQPEYIWQSSAGVDDFEPKYSLTPLIFGTIKATFYSMLFGLPIAILAAIFSSEFLNPKLKTRLKPLIEMMASLPSVVLGFLAALVIAPFVEKIVPITLACFITIPFTFLAAAYVWQLLPQPITTKYKNYRFLVICFMVPVGILLGAVSGGVVENILFSGDLVRWLNGQIGSGMGGWFIILLPLSAILVISLIEIFLRSRIRNISSNWSRKTAAIYDISKFGFGILASLAISAVAAWVLTKIGFDPRGDEPYHFVGTYVQRNAMIVGFIMGFAIIPIIYTLADDALSSVPDHLRSASLGAGATPWQTAIRIVVPTAMSGLFSAAMIGLGRAVGETMIVLMAAGNTPVMQMNIFNGFRTLSANIAVELPEAPVGGTHYRVLFLAALSLFIMTFIINTIAEIVRLRFRKRAFKL